MVRSKLIVDMPSRRAWGGQLNDVGFTARQLIHTYIYIYLLIHMHICRKK